MLAGRVCGLAMNGGFRQKDALAAAESRILGSVLLTIVRGVAEHCEMAVASISLASTLIVKSAPNLSIRMSNMRVEVIYENRVSIDGVCRRQSRRASYLCFLQ